MLARLPRVIFAACLGLMLCVGLVPAVALADEETFGTPDVATEPTAFGDDQENAQNATESEAEPGEGEEPEEGAGDEGEIGEGDSEQELVDLSQDERVVITLSKDVVTYNGEQRKPAVSVLFGEEKLVLNEHFTVEYSNNTNAGEAKVIVRGVEEAGYTGSVTKTFTIKPASIVKAKLSATVCTYNAKTHAPYVTVNAKVGGVSKTIFKGRKSNNNVRVVYSGKRIYVGEYKVKVVGQGNYTGTITKTFKINPAGVSLKPLKSWSRSIEASWAKRTTQVTGYQVRVSSSKSMGNSKVYTVKNSKTISKRIDGLGKYKRYYVQVRTYKRNSTGRVFYSKWSAQKTIKTVKPTLSEGVGITRSQLVASLQSHRYDGYYLGTPWTTGGGAYNGNIWPNGHPRSDGYRGFNCGGFVTRAFLDAGADLSGIARVAAAGSSAGMGTSGALSWYEYALKKGYKVTYYSSINAMLASGDLKKGDIVFTRPVSWGDPDADTHIMIFWGNNSHDNKVWQTSGRYNNIGPVKLGCTRSYLYVISMGA